MTLSDMDKKIIRGQCINIAFSKVNINIDYELDNELSISKRTLKYADLLYKEIVKED